MDGERKTLLFTMVGMCNGNNSIYKTDDNDYYGLPICHIQHYFRPDSYSK